MVAAHNRGEVDYLKQTLCALARSCVVNKTDTARCLQQITTNWCMIEPANKGILSRGMCASCKYSARLINAKITLWGCGY